MNDGGLTYMEKGHWKSLKCYLWELYSFIIPNLSKSVPTIAIQFIPSFGSWLLDHAKPKGVQRTLYLSTSATNQEANSGVLCAAKNVNHLVIYCLFVLAVWDLVFLKWNGWCRCSCILWSLWLEQNIHTFRSRLDSIRGWLWRHRLWFYFGVLSWSSFMGHLLSIFVDVGKFGMWYFHFISTEVEWVCFLFSSLMGSYLYSFWILC